MLSFLRGSQDRSSHPAHAYTGLHRQRISANRPASLAPRQQRRGGQPAKHTHFAHTQFYPRPRHPSHKCHAMRVFARARALCWVGLGGVLAGAPWTGLGRRVFGRRVGNGVCVWVCVGEEFLQRHAAFFWAESARRAGWVSEAVVGQS